MCRASLLLTAAVARAFTSRGGGHVPSRQASRLVATPKVVVFDLDGCLWEPEMYQLSWGGGGAPFYPDGDVMISKRNGEAVSLLGDVRSVIAELHTDQRWADAIVAISSRTDEPAWARELLDKGFRVDDFALGDAFSVVEIAKDSKVAHFQRIAEKTSVGFEDMVFFDNELGNCRQISMLGVTVGYCPEGVDDAIWRAALDAFPAPAGEIVGLDSYGWGR